MTLFGIFCHVDDTFQTLSLQRTNKYHKILWNKNCHVDDTF